MKRLLNAPALAIAVVLATAAGAFAEPVGPAPLAYNYNWSPVGADGVTPTPSVSGDGGFGSVLFTNEETKKAVGNSILVATNLRVNSAASASAPDILSTNGNYWLNLRISIPNTDLSKTLTFGGKLSGFFSLDGTDLSNEFTKTGPNAALRSFTLGSYSFTVELKYFTPPGPPDQANAGSIAAKVSVSRITPAEQTPEPSSLILSGLGLTFFGGAAWRKRRNRKVTASA